MDYAKEFVDRMEPFLDIVSMRSDNNRDQDLGDMHDGKRDKHDSRSMQAFSEPDMGNQHLLEDFDSPKSTWDLMRSEYGEVPR